jgi:hypothetical protein
MVAVSFIGEGNRRKPPTCRKSLTYLFLLIVIIMKTTDQNQTLIEREKKYRAVSN